MRHSQIDATAWRTDGDASQAGGRSEHHEGLPGPCLGAPAAVDVPHSAGQCGLGPVDKVRDARADVVESLADGLAEEKPGVDTLADDRELVEAQRGVPADAAEIGLRNSCPVAPGELVRRKETLWRAEARSAWRPPSYRQLGVHQ